MTDKELIYITAIAKHKNISRAAEELLMSQSTLSRCLQKIESAAGVQMFYRTSSGLVPTEAGRIYLEAADSIIRIQQHLQSNLSRMNNMETGRLMLGITSYLGTLILPRIISVFGSIYPGIDVHVVEDTSDVVEQKLLCGEVDLAFLHLPLRNDGLCCEHIADDELLLVVPSEDPINSQEIPAADGLEPFLPLDQIAHRKFILLQPNQQIRQISAKVFEAAKIVPNIRFATRNPHTVIAMAQQQLGFGMIPRSYTELYNPNESRVKLYRMKNMPTRIELGICSLEGAALSKTMREMINISKATLPYIIEPKKAML